MKPDKQDLTAIVTQEIALVKANRWMTIEKIFKDQGVATITHR
ncbi:hypothetical protein [Mucilaginibacter sp. UYCu711]